MVMSSKGEVNEHVTRVNPQRGIELSDPRNNTPVGLPQEIYQARQVGEVGMNLLSSSYYNSLYMTHSLRSESNTTVDIGIIEVLLQHSVEALSSH